MKKPNIVIAFIACVILFACKKNNDDVSILNKPKSDTANLPHYNETNTPSLTWDQLPAELRDAPTIKSVEQANRGARVSEATGACNTGETPTNGGEGGALFGYRPTCDLKLIAVGISAGSFVDKLEVWYRDIFGRIIRAGWGGDGGAYHIYYLDADEIITAVSGRAGSYVDFLSFYTNKKAFSGGGTGGSPFYVNAPVNGQIFGFHGRSGIYIDAIGFYTKLDYTFDNDFKFNLIP